MTEKRFRTGKGILEEGYFSETIIDNETGKAYYKGYANYESAKEMCELLNKLIEENEQLKQQLTDCKEKKQQMKEFFMNSEPVIEQKKLQKLIYQTVINLIDDKIDELQKKYDFGQKNGFYPMYNYNIRHSINVLKKMKKELEE